MSPHAAPNQWPFLWLHSLISGQNYNEGLGLAMVLGLSGYNGRDRLLGDI